MSTLTNGFLIWLALNATFAALMANRARLRGRG